MGTIDFTPNEPVEWRWGAVQTDDGTRFFLNEYLTPVIIASNNGVKTEPIETGATGSIRDLYCFGNELFFITEDRKIYKSTLLLPDKVHTEFVRELENNLQSEYRRLFNSHTLTRVELTRDESRVFRMLLTRERDGRKTVYRACQNVDEGIAMDVDKAFKREGDDDALEGTKIVSIHRGKIILGREKGSKLVGRAISPNIITLDVPEGYDNIVVYANDESPLIYLLTDVRELTALNPKTMESLSFPMSCPTANLAFTFFSHIIGVLNGQITVRGSCDIFVGLFTADLPESVREMEANATKECI